MRWVSTLLAGNALEYSLRKAFAVIALRLRGSISFVVLTMFLSGFPLQDALSRSVSYDVRKQNLSDVIDTLSDLSGVAVIKLGPIAGTIENWRVKAEGLDVFKALAKDAGLFMAFDGSSVLLASRSNVRTEILPSGQDWRMVQSVAKSLYPVMPEDALHRDSETGVMLVRGPPSFNEAILNMVVKPQSGVVRVIKGGSIQDVNAHPQP